MSQQSIEFHIQENDYFGTLATVLDLIRQDLDRREYGRHSATLARLRDNLMYLQHFHGICHLKSRAKMRKHAKIPTNCVSGMKVNA
jgi:hypothetical protein